MTPDIDLFASSKNKQTKLYFKSKTNTEDEHDNNCLGSNAFEQSWETEKTLFCNPPWNKISDCIDKIKKDKSQKVILITPTLSNTIKELAIARPLKINNKSDTFITKNRQSSMIPVGKAPWPKTWAVQLFNPPQNQIADSFSMLQLTK